ncbi:hypothetical protein SAMD00023353_0900520 [Rosellinia necatrix]|uniref:Methyltransferase type 11 domain-containing protein n=1 Tax=Rosellinia necatrix TaxID=77044 RepID=A0A1W2THI2_ROSNE|nr:hypothetical protein SAMD00023353_0900520 [Rosellinia necatrix]
MFDVIWTDPNVELMGQRMLRKEQEAKEKEKRKTEGNRQSVSTSSVSSSSERGFNLFSKAKRKGSTPSRQKTNKSAHSQEEQGGSSTTAHRASKYGVKAALTGQDESDMSPKPSQEPLLSSNHFEREETYPSSQQDPTLSKWVDQTAVTTETVDNIAPTHAILETKTESYIQALDPSSYVTQTIETVVRPRIETDVDQLIIETQISFHGTKMQVSPLEEVPEDKAVESCEEHEPLPLPYICSRTPPAIEPQNNDRFENLEAWKPPHEWECTPTKKPAPAAISGYVRISPASPEANGAMFPAFVALQRERWMMAAATPELILANLKSTMGEATEGSVYRELEMTKKRWMFSALHQQGGYAQLMEGTTERPETPTPPRRTRILALYETQASASFLLALYPTASLTHLSTCPLSSDLFPNVQPLLVPSVSVPTSSRAIPPRLYSAVTCLSMPSLLPSAEIPPFLRHIHRCLAPGGALHLTIVDPQPVSESMGPKLRQWLFANLLVNLEQAFRTTWPSETFPAWLAVGNLRGKGSTIATISVPAIADNDSQADAKTELRSLVNRMLWQEIWGKFVNASQWWWEEEEIAQECIELGTYWQYSYIIAVKGDRC